MGQAEEVDLWIKEFTNERVPLPMTREDLQLHLQRELREKIPISDLYVNVMAYSDLQQRCDATFKKLFVRQNHGITLQTMTLLWHVFKPTMPSPDTTAEDSYHYFWDSLIVNVLREISKGRCGRNTNASTSTGLYCPDLCFYYPNRDVCVFRGEEKASGPMQTPVRELYDKLIWRYDDAPYVFGYAAVSFQVCLVVIRKDMTTSHGAKTEVIQNYDLSELEGRLSFLLALLNLFTLFRPEVELIRPLSTPDYGTITQANGVKIFFSEDNVVKVYPPQMPSDNIINNLATIHYQMVAHSVPNVVSLLKTDLKRKHVVLAPIGRITHPSDVKELVMALRDILKALVSLHNIGLMHRDLRWDNVLKYRHDRDEWFLIDFDEAALAPADRGVPHLHSNSHAPEISSPHSIEVDIWGVGYLVHTTTVPDLPPKIKAIKESCLQPNLQGRPSAAILLNTMQKM